MSITTLVKKLDHAWLADGFLGKLRQREFDVPAYMTFESLLHSIRQLNDLNAETIDRKLVKALWFVPQFVEWQVPSLIEAGVDETTAHAASSNIRELVGLILGEP